MQDRQLYQQILGIASPWFVERVELKLGEGDVHVHLAHDNHTPWCCPECGAECPIYDHASERTWRHLDTCQYQTLLHAAVPRTKCPEHGVRTAAIPWAEPLGRFTALFGPPFGRCPLAIDWLKSASRKAVAARLRLSWDEVDGIMQRAVRRGLKRREAEEIAYLGVDEKSFKKGIATRRSSPICSRVMCCTWRKTASSRAWTASGRR